MRAFNFNFVFFLLVVFIYNFFPLKITNMFLNPGLFINDRESVPIEDGPPRLCGAPRRVGGQWVSLSCHLSTCYVLLSSRIDECNKEMLGYDEPYPLEKFHHCILKKIKKSCNSHQLIYFY